MDGDLENFFAHVNQASPPSLLLGDYGMEQSLIFCSAWKKNRNLPRLQLLMPYFLMVRSLSRNFSRVRRHSVCAICFVAPPNINQSGSRLGCLSGIEKGGGPSFIDGFLEPPGLTKKKKNWQGFLRVDDNKTQLFQFLSTCAGEPVQDVKAIYATQGVE